LPSDQSPGSITDNMPGPVSSAQTVAEPEKLAKKQINKYRSQERMLQEIALDPRRKLAPK